MPLGDVPFHTADANELGIGKESKGFPVSEGRLVDPENYELPADDGGFGADVLVGNEKRNVMRERVEVAPRGVAGGDRGDSERFNTV